MYKKYLKYIFGFLSFLICIVAIIYNKYYYYHELDLSYNYVSIPRIDIKIEDKQYKVVLDIGSKFSFSLVNEMQNEIKSLKKGKKIDWKDFKGNKYESDSFIIPKIFLNQFVLKNVAVPIKDDSYKKNITTFLTIKNEEEQKDIDKMIPYNHLKDKSEKLSGYIGRAAFKNRKILLDFINNKMIISNDLKKLQKMGYDLKEFEQVPLTKYKKDIILEIDTDKGIKRFALDTGCTVTAYKNFLLNEQDVIDKYNHKIFISKKFCIANKDYGPKEIFSLAITPKLDILDGILGMDFLKDHLLYIDFSNHKLYIK